MYTTENIRNIALYAHIDAGKTTITEQMLFCTGATREPGRVDKGTSTTDYLDVEKERGISVRSSHISMKWKDTLINLIDTPGHVDFISEVGRTLRVPDAAILVFNAAEEIQAQTEVFWNILKKRNIPVILFINKLDRQGADPDVLLESVKNEFSIPIVRMQDFSGTETRDITLKSLFSEDYMDDQLLESVYELDDNLLELFLRNEKPVFLKVRDTINSLFRKCRLFPVLYGSAISGTGISELLDFISDHMPGPHMSENKDLSGVVFKIEHNKKDGRVASVRLYNGSLKPRDTVYCKSADREEKITQIRKKFSSKFTDIKELKSGDIAFVTGLKKIAAGDIIGDEKYIPNNYFLNNSVIRIQVIPTRDEDYSDLAEALLIMSDEDPDLGFTWYKDEREFFISITGKIRVEIIENTLSLRFGIEAEFGTPKVIFKETPLKAAHGYADYTMPKPCWAKVKFLIEPGESGSGIKYESLVSVDKIPQKYQNEIEFSVNKTLKQGPKGWEVTDIRVTLEDGEHHTVHSRPGDFLIATPMALMEGLEKAGTAFLEPVLDFSVTLPAESTGRVTGDLIKMRAEIFPFTPEGNFTVIKGIIPVESSMDYSIRVNSLTSGRAQFFTSFRGYRRCDDKAGEKRDYRGVYPLDRAKFILHARKAL